ncbi:MAG: diacylglycerol kinase family protein [Anaerolineales bacterium]|nr:diacylglycerol kinase family protein [Anaerolineales bacterium]
MKPPRSPSLLLSFRNAFNGLRYALRTQRNARIHLTASLLVLAVGLWLGLSRMEWCLIILSIGMVWMGELSNTVLENVVDLLCPEYHALAKTAKDVKAGVVVVASASAVLVGVLILGPRLLLVLQSLL